MKISHERKPRNLANFIGAGTLKGTSRSETDKKKISEAKRNKTLGQENSQFGTCWITNGFENQKIKKSDLEIWISNGWSLGRYWKSAAS
jgi:hypothetical protein